MASLSNRSLRRLLLARGVSRRFIPQTRLAQLAAYATAIAFLFGLLWHVLLWTGGNEGAISFAFWWYNATRIVAGILLFALLIRWIRQRFLWSLRRRLFVTYFFIGVIPILLMVLMALGSGFLVGNQYAASLASADIKAELDSLRIATKMLSVEASNAKKLSTLGATASLRAFSTEFPGATVALWQGDAAAPAFVVPAGAAITRPDWAKAERGAIANDAGKLYLRVVRPLETASGPATLVTSEPIDKTLLDRVGRHSGVVRFS